VTTAFAAIQLRGIGLGALIQEFATSFIGLVIVLLSLVLFFVGVPQGAAAESMPADNTLSDWSLVIATIIFTYDGWLYAAYFSGELKGGAGAAARACIKGMVIVIALYMLMNAALVKSAGLAALAGSDLALARALELATLPAAGNIIVIAAILILLSHQNLAYMGGPRILQALAEDGFATQRATEVGKGGNPVFAVNLTWALSVGLIWIGGFEFLLLLSVFFYVPMDGDRPYVAWAHPYSTIVCLIGWTVITLFQAYVERETALYAVALIAISWPVYWYLTRK
jgi:APA family basic amino acid/polyamine antiporter